MRLKGLTWPDETRYCGSKSRRQAGRLKHAPPGQSQMNSLLPPLCLLLAMALFITGFTMLALDRPSPTIELHEARIGDDAQQRSLLEEKLRRRQRHRRWFIAATFTGGTMLTITAFGTMRRGAG